MNEAVRLAHSAMHAKALGYAFGRNDAARTGHDSALFAELYANAFAAMVEAGQGSVPGLLDAWENFIDHGTIERI